ncbi:CUB and zona pellucida-like domain-containing protein 1 [Pagrus major]|uniref:CUB and zona pellucida-like domain-containing protein 1 n=1 Tax=Pagrus major TaxID=143350 RepID=UPI003CC8DD8A
MASTLVILLLPLLVSLASASHHYGATSTFTYKGKNPDGSHRVDVRSRETFTGCWHILNWYCYNGNCGSRTSYRRGTLDNSTNGARWCETETVSTRIVPNDKPFNLRVPQNCPRTYKLPSFDPDGDNVRCRYGSIRSVECSSCRSPSGFDLDQGATACEGKETSMVDNNRSSNHNHSRMAVVEGADNLNHSFPHNHNHTAPTTTTTAAPTTTSYPGAIGPLSKLPLHFSFLVDPPAPSCEEGLYLPKLLPPTPANGERIQAEINKELEIKVKAQASYARIIDIIISGPLNISKHRTTNGDFAIRWTPITDELGNYYSICFAVESMAGSRIYQSEMRCVVVDVVDQKVKSYVSCSESTMTVEIEKSSFPRLHEDSLRLNDPTNTICSLQRHSNSTHVIAVIPLNACGTEIEEDEDNLIFTNEITTVDRRTDVITRKHLLEVQVCCQYPKRGNVSQSFTVHRPNVTVWEKGYGKFTYRFEFYPDSTFRTMVDPNTYPLEYEIGSRIFMQIEATSSINNTVLFVESCSAAPYDNPNSRPKYTIIENGCNVDSTLQRHTPDHQRQFQFSMEAFKFIGRNNQVYISCSVMMCEAGNPNTRCAQGCLNSTQLGGRSKREAVTQTSRHLVSQGPLRLKRSAEGAESPVMNLNLVFIAGCLLAAVGMISAVVMYKTKMSKVKYQPLPTFES